MATTNEEKVLGKIRALLERAGHPSTPEPEADACRERAEKMMIDYAIEEAELDASRPAAARMVPEKIDIDICAGDNPIAEQLCTLLMTLAVHCRCKLVFYNYGGSQKYWRVNASVVGYSSDLRYLEMLFTTIYLHIAGHIEPSPDPKKSFDENVYILHEAGVKWRRIAFLMNKASIIRERPGMRIERAPGTEHWYEAVRPSKSQPDVLVPWPDGHRLINAYRRHCALIGEEPRAIQSPVTYQRNFAIGYVGRISARLYAMRQSNPTAGTALALRTEAVSEKFDELFPPETLGTSKRRDVREDYEAQSAGRRAGDRADLSGGRNATEGGKRELS